jgi:hypothetical protein
MRRRQTTRTNPFSQLLKENGWLLKTATDPILAGLGLDEYVYILRADRLLHLHLSPSDMTWEAKRYTREPFGDYTGVYQPKGSGQGIESLRAFVAEVK